MKKLFYYAFVSLLALVLAVLSIVSSGTQKPSNSLFGEAAANGAKSHIQNITSLNDSDAVFSYIVDEAIKISGEAALSAFSVSVIESTQHYGMEDAKRYGEIEADIFLDKTVKNILVVLKSVNTSTEDTLLITTHYDRAVASSGTYDSALNIAIMLEAMKHLSTQQIPNQVAFLFTDAHHAGNTGLKKFLDLSDTTLKHPKDTGYYTKERDIISSTKLAVVLSGYGSSGAVSLYMTGEADYNTAKLYINGGGQATTGGSAIKSIFSHYASSDPASIIKNAGKNILAFSAFGDRHIPASSLDNYSSATFNTSLLAASGDNLFTVLKIFSASTLNLKTEGRVPSATYFSYLGKTVNMSFSTLFIMIALIVLIFAVAIYFNLKNKNKKLNYYKLLLACSVFSVVILCGLIGAAALQTFLGLFGGFGAVLKSSYFASGILDVGFIIFSLGIMILAKYFYDRYFKARLDIGAIEFAQAPAFIFLLLSLFFTIFSYQTSYLFSIIALICGINFLLKNIIKNDFFASLNLDIIAVAVCLPIYIYFVSIMSALAGAVAVTEAVPIFGILFMFILPAFKFKTNAVKAETAEAPILNVATTDAAAQTEGGVKPESVAAEAEDAKTQNVAAEAANIEDTPAQATETSAKTEEAPAQTEIVPQIPSAPAPKHKFLKFINSLTAGVLACVIGFVFVLCGGFNSSIRNQLGAKITYQTHSSALQKEAYTNAVVYTYGQKVIDTNANTEDTTFSYTIMGKDNYNALKKHTKIFNYSKNMSTATAQKKPQPILPKVAIGNYYPMPEANENPDVETVKYASIVYSVTFTPTALNADYEITIQNISRLSTITLAIDDMPQEQIDAGDGIFDNKSSIKLVLRGVAKIDLHFSELSEPSFDNLPKPSMVYKELKKNAPIPPELSFLADLNINFNIIFTYQVSLTPSEIIDPLAP